MYNGGGKTWNQWQSSGYDGHGYNSNPLFNNVQNLDFSVESSSNAVDKGVSLNTPYNVDYMGIARPHGVDF